MHTGWVDERPGATWAGAKSDQIEPPVILGQSGVFRGNLSHLPEPLIKIIRCSACAWPL